jgi:hypothetical protein
VTEPSDEQLRAQERTLSNLTLDALKRTMAECDLIARPWAPYIGLVTLHRSGYVARDAVFALDASRTMLPGTGELGQMLVIHPDDVTTAQGHFRRWSNGRAASDDELAAWLHWLALEKRAQERT